MKFFLNQKQRAMGGGAPLNLVRGTVVRFPPNVTTPGKVTTYCITPTWGNKPAWLLFVTENKLRKLGVQYFQQSAFVFKLQGFDRHLRIVSTCLNCLKYPDCTNCSIKLQLASPS